MLSAEERRTFVAKISDLESDQLEPLTLSVTVIGEHSILVPLGLSDRYGKAGNPFFYFNYSIAQPMPSALTFEVLHKSGKLLFSLNIAPEFMYPGQYMVCWDGFDQQDVFDTRIFNQFLEARLRAIGENKETSVSKYFACHYARVNWIDIIIDRKSKRIDGLLRTNFRDGGENKNENRTRTYQELLQLAKEGLAYHWSRNAQHSTAKGIAIGPDEYYSFYLKADNDTLIGIRSPKIIYQTNGRARRSRNWELSRLLFYNTGALKHGSKWYHKGDKKADADFKQIAAHEIGHEILLCFGGQIHSKSHKGSSTILTQRPLGNFNYPQNGEIDLMIYYKENAQCPYPLDYNERNAASEDDVLSLIWLSQIKITLSKE